MGKSAEEMYQERLNRVNDAIQLKVPDRVPVLPHFSFFPAKYTGITLEEVFYDYDKWRLAYKKTLLDFEPDMYPSPMCFPGAAYETLGLKQIKWPGHGVSPDYSFQYLEGEYMLADEYDAFLEDPADYMVRTYLPRIYETLEPLRRLPSLKLMLFGYTGVSLTAILARPEVRGAFESLLKAGHQSADFISGMSSFDEEMAELGFPSWGKVVVRTAFDNISDYLRGMRGTMLDMYRQPDKLLQAIEKLSPVIIESVVSEAKTSGSPRVFIPLHRGADGFMSLSQFETFYWPTLKRLILALIDEGLTPCPFFEGSYDSRLEYLLELPKGKVFARFDCTDLFKAKEVIGDTICILGNVPVTLLQLATPEEVRGYCKRLIDVVGEGGGFVMGTGGVLDEAKPENVHAMIDFTKSYGVYR